MVCAVHVVHSSNNAKILNFGFFSTNFGSICRYPFNWKTPIGYLFALLSQCGSSLVILYTVCPTICLLVGTSWLLIGCCEDIANELPHLNQFRIAQRGELKERICSIAQMYADVKEFSASLLFKFFSCSLIFAV